MVAMLMVPEMAVNHSQSSGLENVCLKRREQKSALCVCVPHFAAATHHP